MHGDFTTGSSGQARQLLTQFDSFEKEKATMQTSSFVELQSIGQLLASEKVPSCALSPANWCAANSLRFTTRFARTV